MAVATRAWEMISDPFTITDPTTRVSAFNSVTASEAYDWLQRRGIGGDLHGRHVGFVAGLYRALNPYIQVLKPISPLAWMPLFLYTIKDSTESAIMVIFMSSLWPILANTAFGVAGIKRDYLNVSALLQLSWFKRLWEVILPAPRRRSSLA